MGKGIRLGEIGHEVKRCVTNNEFFTAKTAEEGISVGCFFVYFGFCVIVGRDTSLELLRKPFNKDKYVILSEAKNLKT